MELPKGWLGKNHASIRRGTGDGDLILFTDADVVMERSSSAARHLPATRRIRPPGHYTAPANARPLAGYVRRAFALFFGLYAKPWKARDPISPRHIGIGAFNLVRAEVYRAVGGHRRSRCDRMTT